MYINQTTPSNYQCNILNSKKMTFLHQRFLLSCLIMFTFSQLLPVSSRGPIYKPPSVERLTDRFHSTPVDGKMTTFFGASHIHMKSNGSYADIVLDKTSGKNNHYKFIIAYLLTICCVLNFDLLIFGFWL